MIINKDGYILTLKISLVAAPKPKEITQVVEPEKMKKELLY